MRINPVWVAAGVALAIAGAAVAWWLVSPDTERTSMPTSAGTGRILYYQDPSGAPVYSATPKTDREGRAYVAVRESGGGAATAPTGTQQDRRVLYYRNPMGLADTSPVPKKDSMGMDYIPVYADDAGPPGAVRVSLDKVQRLGVRTADVKRERLSEAVVLSGTLAADERRQSVVSLKFKAWIPKLHVAATGERVRAGQPLFDIYSPFVLQQETTLAIALNARDASQRMDDVYARTNARSETTARERLSLYEIPKREVERLIRTRKPSGHVTWYAPQAGTVLEKSAIAGMYAEEGTVLYRLADLSNIWVIAEAPETAIAIAKPGAVARVSLNAFPGQTFEGKVTFVYPEVALATRTVKVRIELANPDQALLPGMFASVEITAAPAAAALAVPDSAMIESGTRRVVLVARGEGLFEPRAVTTGRRANGMVEILTGLQEGESVVTSATFLIDAESNLRAALQGFTADASKGPTQ